jgi:hypothetical protein
MTEAHILIIIGVYLVARFTDTWDALKCTLAYIGHLANKPLVIATATAWLINIVMLVLGIERPGELIRVTVWLTAWWLAIALYVAGYRFATGDFSKR